jgi:ribosomal protein S12 methylthiotransferase
MVKKIYLARLGCAKNQIDGELMLGRAAAEGCEVVDDPDQADVLVVNTCGFIDAAREESVDAILAMAGVKAESADRKLVVTGCMAERYTDELAREIPEVDAFVGTGSIDRFMDAMAARDGAVFKGDKHYLPSSAMERLVTETDGSAYLKVSEGCDHECSFCVIPDIRGKHESRTVEDVALEAERLAAGGIVEVNLIAQDLSAYGRDRGMRDGLAALLYRLGRIDGLERVRCYYLYPNTIEDTALEAMRDVDNVCAYVDIPLQHADADVLRSMRRAKDADQLRRLIDRIRGYLGDPVVRSSFIVGYPGETEAAFETLCRFVEEVRFDRLSVFKYSPEQGSPAERLPDRVPTLVTEYRRDALLQVQAPIAAERLARFVGSTARVLVGGSEGDGGVFGRTEGQGPDIDGVTWLGAAAPDEPGRLVDVEITANDEFDLFGEVFGV